MSSTKPRLLLLIPTFERGGAEKQLLLLAGGLPRDRFDVHVCALTSGGPLREEFERRGVKTSVLGKRYKLDPRALWRLTKFLKEHQPDLLHTWLLAGNTYGRVAARLAGVPRVIAAERCVDHWKASHELLVDRLLVGRTDRVTANSTGVKEWLVEHGIPAGKIVVIPNAIECPPRVEPTAEDRAALLAELGLPEDAVLIAMVNRLWPQKRVRDLLWSIELLGHNHPETHLIIAGKGPEEDRLRRFMRQLELERAHLLGERADVARLLAHSACLWLGSGYEGQPNAVMEAMAAGKPVVATDIAGTRDLVVPGETGYLVPVGDRAAFAKYTQVLLEDPELAARMGQAGRERIEKEFPLEAMVRRHVELYEEVLAGKSP